MICTRCDGSGFLNINQVPSDIVSKGTDEIVRWLEDCISRRQTYGCSCHISAPCSICVECLHDVVLCDCCSDGENWYTAPGEHGPNEPKIPECI